MEGVSVGANVALGRGVADGARVMVRVGVADGGRDVEVGEGPNVGDRVGVRVGVGVGVRVGVLGGGVKAFTLFERSDDWCATGFAYCAQAQPVPRVDAAVATADISGVPAGHLRIRR